MFFLPPSLFQKIAENAGVADTGIEPPTAAFSWLAEAGLLQVVLPGEPLDFQQSNTAGLLQLLKETGKANLSVGRIYEGHLNALQLVHLYASAQQKEQWFADAAQHQLFGVWNTQDAEGIRIQAIGNGQYQLKGCKTFCSGAGLVQRPVITGELTEADKKGWQMCIVPMEKAMQVQIDQSFWQPLGMRASASFRLCFDEVIISEADLLGPPDAYYRQPYFSGGAVRFAAVQLGGAAAILDETRQFLQQLNRTEDPFQKARIGEMGWLVESGNLWLQNAGNKAAVWYAQTATTDKIVAYANMTRTAIEDICLRVLQLAERCVGARGLMRPGRLEQLHRDLHFYLRQPAPDATLTAIADYLFTQKITDEPWQ